jgi:DNA-binding CsgD family transcriptional regulator
VVGLSEKTVNYYMRQLTTKLGARNRTHALVKALQMGLVSLN